MDGRRLGRRPRGGLPGAHHPYQPRAGDGRHGRPRERAEPAGGHGIAQAADHQRRGQAIWHQAVDPPRLGRADRFAIRGSPSTHPLPAKRGRRGQQDQPVHQWITGEDLRDSGEQEDRDHRVAQHRPDGMANRPEAHARP